MTLIGKVIDAIIQSAFTSVLIIPIKSCFKCPGEEHVLQDKYSISECIKIHEKKPLMQHDATIIAFSSPTSKHRLSKPSALHHGTSLRAGGSGGCGLATGDRPMCRELQRN